MKKARKPLNSHGSELKNYFPSSKEIMDQAYAKLRKVDVGKKYRDPLFKRKKLNSLKLTTFGDFLQKKLFELGKLFPDIDNMNPFFRDLLGALVSIDKLKMALGKVNASSKVLKKIRFEYAKKIYSSKTPDEANKHLKAFEGRAGSVIKKLNSTLKTLKEYSKLLKEVPTIDFDAFTMVLAGFPNVGKTTLLKRLTKSKAKISGYQFTTKQINTGYFELKYRKVQVLDTPGLLDRSELNDIEKKALAAVKHLASVIVFVIDPTINCGFSQKEQFGLLEQMKKEFKGTKIIGVINKADLATEEEINSAKEKLDNFVLEGEKENGANLREALIKEMKLQPISDKKYLTGLQKKPTTTT
ncbi:MAG: hypothetical protein CL944_00665 [Candidatus Diapherotrites archaeon]|uniref:GTP-binding protein n=1 Tax=Candidatus Iainarchaeum sp. TaxID=3101447 RepID=A0A2D6LP57_9ARCH|nr:hypothetical protein [Candidatus Diapherotrites archaeon]|tara:strand:- start:12539 stop:13606 length:1068 start_codon:yes stop_codon:yes gene_type:complete